jgi:hypothetical protein
MKTYTQRKAILFLGLAPLLLGVAGLHAESALAADDYAQGLVKDRISVKTLLPQMPSKTIIGQDYPYPNGKPLIESYLIELPPGQKTGIHLHQVPLLAYIISGRLETNYGSRGSKVSTAGGCVHRGNRLVPFWSDDRNRVRENTRHLSQFSWLASKEVS